MPMSMKKVASPAAKKSVVRRSKQSDKKSDRNLEVKKSVSMEKQKIPSSAAMLAQMKKVAEEFGIRSLSESALAGATILEHNETTLTLALTAKSWMTVTKSGAFACSQSDFEELWLARPDKRISFTLYGREVVTPRLLQLYQVATADQDAKQLKVSVAGQEYPAKPLAQEAGAAALKRLSTSVTELAEKEARKPHNVTAEKSRLATQVYNACLLNWYCSAEDYIGPHADLEKGIDHKYPIVSVSLGCPRRFAVEKKVRGGKNEKVFVIPACGNGMMLSMGGDFQKEFKHGVPKMLKPEIIAVEDSGNDFRRINFTIRKYDL